MHGFQKFENKRPIYVIGRICDGYVPPERSTLGNTDKNRWHGGKDPWQSVVLLPLYDPASREPFIFTSTNDGGKDAVTALVDAVVDNATSHPDDADKLPICELSGDHYENSNGKTIYTPIFEIMGWTERPAAVRRIRPPPIDMLALEHKSEPAESMPPVRPTASAKPARDMDDEIPF